MFVLARLISLDPEKVLLVKGPASVTCEGSVTVLGKRVDEVSVRAGKILPFETNGSAKVKVRVHSHGSYRISKNENIGVSIWKEVSERIGEGTKRIMLVGATDTGKSTLTTYLSNFANANGLKVGVVDGDVGQGDLAPPGCIGAAVIEKQFLDLRDVDAKYYAFICSNSPMGIEDLVIGKINQTVEKVENESDTCIINTDGYVDEHGIDYKMELAKTIKPDLIVSIGNVLEKFGGFEVLQVNAPKRITKTRVEREERRLAQYARFLGNEKRTFGLKEKNFAFMGKIYNHSIFNGDLIRIEDIILPLDVLKGMFVGLGINSETKGFGLITRIASGQITLKTSLEYEFDIVMLSTIGISLNMKREHYIPLITKRYNWFKGSTLS